MDKQIKDFSEVQIGDEAFNDCGELMGRVLAKGRYIDLEKDYDCVQSAEEIIADGIEDSELQQCVAVSEDPSSTLEGYTSMIYLYNVDPSSAYCYK